MGYLDDVRPPSNRDINPDPRCACVLVLDTSGSMGVSQHPQEPKPIDELNDGLLAFENDIKTDAYASRRVEVAVVTFGYGGAHLLQDFVSAGDLQVPRLMADGDTPMGQAITIAIDAEERQKALYRQQNLAIYRSWIFLVTDGKPTDAWQTVIPRIHQMDQAKHIAFFAVGTETADMQTLAQIAPPWRPPLMLRGLAFREMFLWLSDSLGSNGVSGKDPVPNVPLKPTDGWAVV